MAIISVYYFLQPFDVVGCVRHVTICRVGLYADFMKSPFRGCFFLNQLICEIGLYAGIYGSCQRTLKFGFQNH